MTLKELKKQIEAVQHAVEELQDSGIRPSLLNHAILQSAKRYYTGNANLTTTMVKATLAGIETLREYAFPEEGEN